MDEPSTNSVPLRIYLASWVVGGKSADEFEAMVSCASVNVVPESRRHVARSRHLTLALLLAISANFALIQAQRRNNFNTRMLS